MFTGIASFGELRDLFLKLKLRLCIRSQHCFFHVFISILFPVIHFEIIPFPSVVSNLIEILTDMLSCQPIGIILCQLNLSVCKTDTHKYSINIRIKNREAFAFKNSSPDKNIHNYGVFIMKIIRHQWLKQVIG